MDAFPEHAIVVSASRDRVWSVLADVDAWRAWMPGIRWAVLEGDLASGSYVTIRPQRGLQTAFRVNVAAPLTALALGLTFGPAARLERTWTLVPDAAGTRVVHALHVAGPLRRWLAAPLARRLDADADAMLAALARAVAA